MQDTTEAPKEGGEKPDETAKETKIDDGNTTANASAINETASATDQKKRDDKPRSEKIMLKLTKAQMDLTPMTEEQKEHVRKVYVEEHDSKST